MEVNTINLNLLHNEEHFQYQKDFKEHVELYGDKTLNIEEKFNTFVPLLVQEEEALNLIRKSDKSKQIEIADDERDDVVNGLTDTVNALTKHFDPEKRAAAGRYKIMLDQYGKIARKPYDDETAAIYKLVKESQTTFAVELDTLSLNDWITLLNAKNTAFEDLKKGRNKDEAQKTEVRMKNIRVEVDAAYKEIIKRINALIIVNGPALHEVFVKELNTRIDKVSNTLAQRKGRSVKNAEKNQKKLDTGSATDTEKK